MHQEDSQQLKKNLERIFELLLISAFVNSSSNLNKIMLKKTIIKDQNLLIDTIISHIPEDFDSVY